MTDELDTRGTTPEALARTGWTPEARGRRRGVHLPPGEPAQVHVPGAQGPGGPRSGHRPQEGPALPHLPDPVAGDGGCALPESHPALVREFAQSAQRDASSSDRWACPGDSHMRRKDPDATCPRAIDQFRLGHRRLPLTSARRRAALRFFERTIGRTRISPVEVTSDVYRVSTPV